MIAVGAILLGAAGGLFLLEQTRPAAVAARDERRRSADEKESVAVTTALRGPETLSLEVSEDAATVNVLDPALPEAAAARTVIAFVEFFAAEMERSRPPSAYERRQRKRFERDRDVERPIAVYRMPLRFTAQANAADPAGFAGFLLNLRELPGRVSADDLAYAAERAYLATRPDGFDRTGFYLSRR